MIRIARGLTLVEVLIAATILFAALTIASESYRTALASSTRASTVVRILAPTPAIVSTIRQRLRDAPLERMQGGGEMLGVDYEFEAVSVRFTPPPAQFDADLSDFAAYEPRFRLYDVKLRLSAGGQQRLFVYQELAWTPLKRR